MGQMPGDRWKGVSPNYSWSDKPRFFSSFLSKEVDRRRCIVATLCEAGALSGKRALRSAAIRLGLSGATCRTVILLRQLHATRRFHHCVRHRECLLSVTLERSLGHLDESFLNAGSLNRAGLIEKHVVVFARPLLTSRPRNLTLRLLIELVADADEGEGLRVGGASVLIEAISPAGERLEARLARDVIDQGAAVSSAVKSIAQRLELLLSGGVPDL
mmetsp:Transcript_8884/g.12162  ORF Transcript_8884/g.12162 Transcript_8884/m.12162 type:complete len:216 (+) Transcript_8884:33-680(+)